MSMRLTGWLSSQKKPQVPLTARDLGRYQEKAPVTTRYVTCTMGSLSQERVFVPCCARQWLCPRTGILSHAVLGNGYQCPGTGILFQDSFWSMLCLTMAINVNVPGLPSLCCLRSGPASLTWVALLHPTVSNNGNQNQCPVPWIKKPVITWTMDSLSWMVVLSPLVSSTSDTLDSMSVSQARQASNDWR